MKNKKFIIVDSLAMAYKAYFAFQSRPLYTKKGEPTSAVFGFVNQLIKIYEDFKPDYIAAAFDSKEKTFRHEMYKEYKATRSDMPDDMVPQLARIKEVVETLKIPILILPGYEADDIIGSISKLATKEGFLTYMISPDKDYIQLVTKTAHLIRPGRSGDEYTLLDPPTVLEKYEFKPEQMIDYLSLVGDTSDNIPGARGIGDKTATKLIKEFGDIDTIYKKVDEVKPDGVKKKLLDSQENVMLSRKLVTIDTDIPYKFDFKKAIMEKPDLDKLKNLFMELEFIRAYQRVVEYFNKSGEPVKEAEVTSEDMGQSVFSSDTKKYTLVKTKKEMLDLAKLLKKQKLFVFDTETDSLDRLNANMVGCAFSFKKDTGYYVPVHYTISDSSWPVECTIDTFKEIFTDIFEDGKIHKVCQNGKYDISILRNYDINVNGFHFDTMIASYILDPDQKHNMDELSRRELNYDPIPLSSLIGEKKDPTKIYAVAIDRIANYSAEDADVTYQLYEILSKKIKANKQDKLAYEIEFPLVNCLEEMERSGIRVDTKTLKQQSKELGKIIEEETAAIHEIAGQIFNVGSPTQLQKILFDNLKLPPTKKIKTGYSTDAQSLESLRGEHEIIEHILTYRQVTKLKSTYTDSLPGLINPTTGRIHSSFNQTVAATGRLASLDPNLQNIPIRTDLGRDIRKAFVPRDKDYILLSADYSQIELRIMAHLSADEYLVNAFKKGQDIHRSTAALVFGTKPEDVTADMRRKAKEVNFGILYGIGVFGLKTRLGIPQAQAKEIIDGYFKTFKRVRSFMDDIVQSAKEKGYAETISGRRRYLKNINSKNFAVRQFEERVAINMPIQGAAADMIKIAMVNLYEHFKKKNYKSRMVLQVHDELLFDVYKPELEEIRAVVKDKMENAMKLKVPITVDSGVGDNWLDAH